LQHGRNILLIFQRLFLFLILILEKLEDQSHNLFKHLLLLLALDQLAQQVVIDCSLFLMLTAQIF